MVWKLACPWKYLLTWCCLYFRNSIETNVEVVSKGESGLEENPIILDLGKDRMKIVKEYESKKREAVIKNNSKSREDTNSTLSNFDYHPIMSFFNDY